jgi:hypothetical protein
MQLLLDRSLQLGARRDRYYIVQFLGKLMLTLALTAFLITQPNALFSYALRIMLHLAMELLSWHFSFLQ